MEFRFSQESQMYIAHSAKDWEKPGELYNEGYYTDPTKFIMRADDLEANVLVNPQTGIIELDKKLVGFHAYCAGGQIYYKEVNPNHFVYKIGRNRQIELRAGNYMAMVRFTHDENGSPKLISSKTDYTTDHSETLFLARVAKTNITLGKRTWTFPI